MSISDHIVAASTFRLFTDDFKGHPIFNLINQLLFMHLLVVYSLLIEGSGQLLEVT